MEGNRRQRHQAAERLGAGSQTLELHPTISMNFSPQCLGAIPMCFLTIQDRVLGAGALETEVSWTPPFQVGRKEA